MRHHLMNRNFSSWFAHFKNDCWNIVFVVFNTIALLGGFLSACLAFYNDKSSKATSLILSIFAIEMFAMQLYREYNSHVNYTPKALNSNATMEDEAMQLIEPTFPDEWICINGKEVCSIAFLYPLPNNPASYQPVRLNIVNGILQVQGEIPNLPRQLLIKPRHFLSTTVTMVQDLEVRLGTS